MPENPPIAAGTRIGHVHLKVADLDRALGFYCGVLGFELQQRLAATTTTSGSTPGRAKAAIRRRRAPPGCSTPQSSIRPGRRWRTRYFAC
jgi:catechol 2,3-dioxygenase-like lactoylglutathione lyase family enzyme